MQERNAVWLQQTGSEIAPVDWAHVTIVSDRQQATQKKHPKTDSLQQGQKTANEDNAAGGKTFVHQVVKVISTSQL